MRFAVIATAGLAVSVSVSAPAQGLFLKPFRVAPMTTEQNTNRPGYDFHHFNLPGSGLGSCQAACGMNPRCKAYTFERRPGGKARCWLKSAAPRGVHNRCCISGARTGAAAPNRRVGIAAIRLAPRRAHPGPRVQPRRTAPPPRRAAPPRRPSSPRADDRLANARPKAPETSGPRPILRFSRPPEPVTTLPSVTKRSEVETLTDASTKRRRLEEVRRYDATLLPSERWAHRPPTFCVRGQCRYQSYREVAVALYGDAARPAQSSPPVFCAQRREPGPAVRWSTTQFECSAEWLDTLGRWRPWKPNGEPSAPPEEGQIPEFACFGSPHLIARHMKVPPGGEFGSGFRCRRRVFKFPAEQAIRNAAQRKANIAARCGEMRRQIWGDAVAENMYNKCNQNPSWRAKGWCAQKPPVGPAGTGSTTPFMRLSREEVLYFFGHEKLFCRADRKGLVHFSSAEHTSWAERFTCGVSRGILEAGPIEEGVQVCAVVPLSLNVSNKLDADLFRTRLHCWKFERPRCEEVSDENFAKSKDNIYRSQVFDAYDALLQVRRTQSNDVWAYKDLKDAEKLKSHQDRLGFADTLDDEGTFGVSEFCRFAGGRDRVQCGYTKETMTQWYELRKEELAEGCADGICDRGAFSRGYYCALFQSPELFPLDTGRGRPSSGKPFWMCGVDSGSAGKALIANAPAVCLGGKLASSFHSPQGDRGSLQCYARRFRWGETPQSQRILKELDWRRLIREAGGRVESLVAEVPGVYWLSGKGNWRHWFQGARAIGEIPAAHVSHHLNLINSALNAVRRKLVDEMKGAIGNLQTWGLLAGHTLGHQTSMAKMLISTLALDFLRLKFSPSPNTVFRPYGCGSAKSAPYCTYLLGYAYPAHGAQAMPVEREALSSARAKILNVLVDEVRRGERLADEKWYREFLEEATADGRLRIQPHELATVMRMHLYQRVMAGARPALFRIAARYAAEIRRASRGRSPALSRPELLAFAAERGAPRPFCVRDQDLFVCGSAALLAAGGVEEGVEQEIRNMWKSQNVKAVREAMAMGGDKFREKIRKQQKLDWCYGSEQGKVFLTLGEAVLWNQTFSSPYLMEVPKGMVRGNRSTVNWLRCSTLEYSDTSYEAAAPGKNNTATDPDAGAQGISVPMTDPRAQKHGGKVLQEVGGLLKKVVAFVMPIFGDAAKRVQNLSHASGEFIEKWVKPIAEKAKALWKLARDNVLGPAKKIVAGLQEQVEKAKAAFQRAQLAAASAVGPAKAMFEKARDLKEKALGKVGAELARQRDRGLVKTLGGLKRDARTLTGLSSMVVEMFEDFLRRVTKRVMALVDPHARSLVAHGFQLVRKVLDPVAKLAIKALAAIPFVGAGLAAVGHMVYSLAMSALQKAAHRVLTGVVERILAKLVRGLVNPAFQFVKNQILKVVYLACGPILGSACPDASEEGTPLRFSALPPKHRWLNRALACPGRPIFNQRMQRDAELARLDIVHRAKGMRRRVASHVRDIANRHLARFGYTYDSWMAHARSAPRGFLLAEAAKINRGLTDDAGTMKALLAEAYAKASR